MNMKQLHIWMRNPRDPHTASVLRLFPHNAEQALLAGRGRVDTVQTTCCSTRWLMEGYRIFLHFPDGTNAKLRLGQNNCTDREIHPEHNLQKLLLAGEFGPMKCRKGGGYRA